MKKFTFLVVDDEPEIVDFIVDLLNDNFECDIFKASNGLEGLEISNKNKLDLIFADFRMPVMNGGEMVKTIREKSAINSKIPILLVSAYLEEAKDSLKIIENVLFIDKPIQVDSLLRNIKMALSTKVN